MRRRLFFAIAVVFCLAGSGFAQDADYAYREAREFARSVQKSPAKRQLRHYWMRAIDRLQAIVDKYPRSPRAAEAQFLVGTLYEDMSQVSLISDDVDGAIAAYRRVVKDYPSHRLADDAQFYVARLYRDRRGDRTGAYVEFEKVVTLFPRGDMADAARRELAKLADAKPAPTLSKSGSLVNVSKVLHWSNKNYTRIAVYLDEKTEFKYDLLPADDKAQKPRRLFIDIKNARLDPSLREPIPIADGLLQQARAGQFSADTVRIVLDMESVGEYKVFPLVSPFRIIVDVYGQEGGAPDDATAVGSKPVEARPISKEVAKVPFTQQLGLTVKRVVIDAGHGGKDPGAIGYRKLREKDVTLRIAKALAAKIKREMKIDAVLTRDDDTFIQLEGRPGIAKAERGDLFISIHCNSAPTSEAYGIETYHLDFTSDRSAIAVAARENASSERGVSEQETILRDLVLTSKRNDSIQLARAVQGSLVTNLGRRYDKVRDLGVKGAPFVVLIGANIPAVLIETGFISNAREAKRLKDAKYVDHLTDSIVDGLKQYVKALQVTTF